MIVRLTPLRVNPDLSRAILWYLELKTEYKVINLLNKVALWLYIEVNDMLCKVVADFESPYSYFEKPSEGFESGHSCFKKALNQLCNKIN